MRELIFEFSKEMTSEKLYELLPLEEKKILENYRDYMMISASEMRTREAIREVLRFKKMVNKKLDDFDLEDLRYFLKELKRSSFADYTKNKIKGFIQHFLKWKFKDWSEKFNEFEDIRFNGDAQRKQEITEEDILTKEDIEKIMVAEKNLFYQTFFITQYEGGLRTGECRRLKWSDIDFDDDEEYCYITISSKKNKNRIDKKREIPLNQATKYLRKLKEQQKSEGITTRWVFPSVLDQNQPVSKCVNYWFRNLTLKVLGKSKYNYLLRHSRGTELQRLVKDNHMSKDNAIQFLGHSEQMFDKVYSHMSRVEIKNLMKKQIYDFKEITPEKKQKLELEMEELKNKLLKEEVERIKIEKKLEKIEEADKQHKQDVVNFLLMLEDSKTERDFLKTGVVPNLKLKSKEA